ncbi:MAG: methionine aminotransferase [Proteobacteria bacterium]|nr:methionine aminotransferase [Pseudomonadota bacterium]
MKIISKLPDVGVTIFTVMSKLAMDNNAINLSQGFPEFDVDSELVSLVGKYMKKAKNQYAPMQGVDSLREKISEKTEAVYGHKANPDTEITVTMGATEALFAAFTAIIKPGDEVLLFEPAYDSYEPAIRLSGGKPVFCQLQYPGYDIDWNQVKSLLSEKTKMIVFNSPHNPSGAILRSADMEVLSDLVENTGIVIVSDEVYEHIVFDGLRHESMLRYPSLSARSFVISSFGKTFHATGWKTGYCIAPAALTKEFRRIHQYLTFACNTPIQHAYAEFLDQDKRYLNLSEFYQRKRDTFLDSIKGSRFKPLRCSGTYFQMLDYSEISKDKDLDFAKWLTIEKGIASIPPSVFYHQKTDHKVLRFCFAKNDETLRSAGEILKTI